jgi:hypothetical protein
MDSNYRTTYVNQLDPLTVPSTPVSTEEFLCDLVGPDAKIYFNVDRKTWKNFPYTYAEVKSKLYWLNTFKHLDICFIPNSGGTKDVEITCFNAAFLDWDCGKDPHGSYFPLEIVAQKKSEFLTILQNSPIKPSYIIETRNGFHVYWFLFPGTTSEQFIRLQKSLISYFKSDPAIINPARVMRLPGYFWYKSLNTCNPFLVNIIYSSSQRYSFTELYQAFLTGKDTQGPCSIDTSNPEKRSISAHNNTSSNIPYNRSIIVGTKRQNTQTLKNLNEAVKYICRQDLAQYLGYKQTQDSTTITCPFHNDKTPSASIYNQDGKYYMKCHSSNCSFKSGTIIQIVAKKENISEAKALLKLMEYYQIQLDSSWKDNAKSIFEKNIQRILHAEDWKEQYPDLFRCIGRIKMDLVSKLEYARNHVFLQSSDGTALFICSLREFERLSSGLPYMEELGRQNQRVDRYCLLGLMHKVHSDHIPWGLWYGLQEVRGKKRYQYWTQVYSVPEYTEELFQQADLIARKLKESGVRMNAISKDLVLSIFGKEKAIEVYPQSEDQISERGKQFQDEVRGILLRMIHGNGYAMVLDLVEHVHQNKVWFNVTDRRVKKYLPGLLVEMDLVEVVSNRGLKECLHIDSKGFPKVIIPRSYPLNLNKTPDSPNQATGGL